MIRIVPDNPGPEFKAVPFACDSRPSRCPDCGIAVCPFGMVPGARDDDPEPSVAQCPACPWVLVVPDAETAKTVLARHRAACHPDPEPPGAA